MATKPHIIRELIRLLDNGDALDRCCACHCLGVIGTADASHPATQALIQRLRDSDIDVCIDAADALGKLGDITAVTPLIEMLHQAPNGEVKVALTEALGQLGGQQSISTLISLLGDQAASQSSAQYSASSWDGDDDWDSHWDLQRKAIQALGKLQAEAAIEALAALLNDEDSQVDETDILLALARIGGNGEQLIIQRLQTDRPRERRRAAYVLGKACSRNGAKALGRALQDAEPEVRRIAAEAIANNNLTQYLSALILLLRDADDGVREAALRAIATLSSQSQQPLDAEKLFPLLTDGNANVRSAALQSLQGNMPETLPPEVQVKILGLFKDPDSRVASAALLHSHIFASEELEDLLCERLEQQQLDPGVRQQAAQALGQQKEISPKALQTLNNATQDNDSIVIWAALQALMVLHKNQATITNEASDTVSSTPDDLSGGPQQSPSSTPLALIFDALRGETLNMQDTDDPCKTENSQAENHATRTSAKTSAKTLANENGENTEHRETTAVEYNAAPTSTLASIQQTNQDHTQSSTIKKSSAADEIPEIAEEEKEEIQDYLDLLSQQQHNKKKFFRSKSINTSDELRKLSARVLGECSQTDTVIALKETLLDTNPEIQHEAVAALARIAPDTPGLKEALGPLTSLLSLSTPDVQVTIAHALGNIGSLKQLPKLQECLSDDHALLRSQAALSICQLLERCATKEKHNGLAINHPHTQTNNRTIESALLDLNQSLSDNNAGVSKAAALSLAKLNKLIQRSKAREHIIDCLIKAAFASESGQARDMGKTLRTIDQTVASDKLQPYLTTLSNSSEKQITIEMLEELYRP